uniref:Uncharacterized protein n=1 Tax=Rhizophagus irregularis (strain DAOM 181602 / DAOM 197198 / MUCL 43194) TaxID=747089 RepID=U9TQ48_RHIID
MSAYITVRLRTKLRFIFVPYYGFGSDRVTSALPIITSSLLEILTLENAIIITCFYYSTLYRF